VGPSRSIRGSDVGGQVSLASAPVRAELEETLLLGCHVGQSKNCLHVIFHAFGPGGAPGKSWTSPNCVATGAETRGRPGRASSESVLDANLGTGTSRRSGFPWGAEAWALRRFSDRSGPRSGESRGGIGFGRFASLARWPVGPDSRPATSMCWWNSTGRAPLGPPCDPSTWRWSSRSSSPGAWTWSRRTACPGPSNRKWWPSRFRCDARAHPRPPEGDGQDRGRGGGQEGRGGREGDVRAIRLASEGRAPRPDPSDRIRGKNVGRANEPQSNDSVGEAQPAPQSRSPPRRRRGRPRGPWGVGARGTAADPQAARSTPVRRRVGSELAGRASSPMVPRTNAPFAAERPGSVDGTPSVASRWARPARAYPVRTSSGFSWWTQSSTPSSAPAGM
jgi:hypothetical protein